MFKRIMLINPRNNILKDSIRRISEPLGLLYVASSLIKHGYEAAVYDMSCEGYDNCVEEGDRIVYGSSDDDLIKELKNFSPDIIGVGCMFSSREIEFEKVVKVARKHFPEIPIVAGGLPPSFFPEKYLKNAWADYVIMEEGEFRMVKLIECLNEKKQPDFDGVAFYDNGMIKINPPNSKIQDLDSIPIPDRSLVDFEKYIEIGAPFAPFAAEERVGQILGTRGCPCKCNFCSGVKFWGNLRYRSVDNIIAEMTELKSKYGIKEIQFVDDNITANNKFATELFTKMKPLGFKYCFPNGIFFNSLNNELIELMAESGAYQLSLAIESGSKRVLKEIIHKNVKLDNVKHIIEKAHEFNISIHGMFIVGFPGESESEIKQTLEFPFKAGFDSASFFMACPLPGSELYDECLEKGYIHFDTEINVDFKSNIINIPPESSDYFMDNCELEKLVDEYTKKFNIWSKTNNPDKWSNKYSKFLKKNKEKDEMILGRVT